MLAIRLDAEIESRLVRLAKKRLQRPAKTYSAEDVKHAMGL